MLYQYRYRLHFDTKFLVLLNFIESLEIFLINMVTLLMMSRKTTTQDLRKIKVFFKKCYGVIILSNYVTNKILSRGLNYIADVVKWPKFGNLELIRIWVEKPLFFESWSRLKFNNLWLTLGTNLKFYAIAAKGLGLKVRKFWGPSPAFV